MSSAFSTLNILGVPISAINLDKAVRYVTQAIEQGQRTYICTCPVHTAMVCVDDLRVRQVVNRAGLVTPDGMPMVWLLKAAGFRHAGRVYGPDLMLACCQHGVASGWRHYLYGGADAVPQELASNLRQWHPGLRVAGAYSPPFRALSPVEDADVVAHINAATPDIVWVGLGSPKQDLWMAEHRARLDAPVLVGVGAAFDFFTGRVPQAPRWLQRSGLEWLFRFLQEPRRLWHRYLINNPRFVWNVMLQAFGWREFPLETTHIDSKELDVWS